MTENSHGIRPFTHVVDHEQPLHLTVTKPDGGSLVKTEPLFETVEPFVHEDGIASIGVENFNSAVEPFVHGIQLNHGHQPHQKFHPEPLAGGRVEPFVHGIEVSSGLLETQPLVQSSVVQPFIHGDDIIEAVPLVSEVHHEVTDPKVN